MLRDRKILAIALSALMIASAVSILEASFDKTSHGNRTVALPDVSPLSPQDTVNSSSNPALFPLYFNETGLPSGTFWSVNLSGKSYTSINSSMLIDLPQGTYSYSTSNSIHFFTGSPSGSVTINGHGGHALLRFTGRISPTGFVNLQNEKFVNSTSMLSGNQSVFPVYGIYDNYSHAVLVVGFSNSLIYEINQYNHSLVSHFQGPDSPDAITFDPANGNIFVSNSTSLYQYNSTGAPVNSVYLGSYLISLSYDPLNGQIMVGSLYGGVYFLNSSTLKTEMALNSISVFSSQSFAFNSGMNAMEVVDNSGSTGKIAFIGKNDQIISQVNATGTVLSIIYSKSSNRTYYIALSGSDSFTYYLNGLATHRIAGTGQSFGIGIDPSLNMILSTNTQNGTIYLINDTTDRVAYIVQDSGMPLMPVSAPGNSGFYVVNPMEDALDLISVNDATASISFMEHGLSTSTGWNVTLNGYTLSSTNPTITFYEAPGNYGYSISNVAGYISPVGGQLEVMSLNISIILQFTKEYSVRFTETGLPGGLTWDVALNGSTVPAASGSNITFEEANGSYHFNITGFNGYRASPSQGYLTVNGSDVILNLDFSTVSYNLTFNAKNLPAGTPWSLSINGIMEKSAANIYTYEATPGVYNYKVFPAQHYYPDTASGSVSVINSNVTVNITWMPYLYRVNFTQDSLPHGYAWSVNISNGVFLGSTGANVSAYLPYGNYSYVYSSSNSSWRGSTGSFQITGKGMTIDLHFMPVLYEVQFNESGLSGKQYWSVNIGRIASNSSFGNEITFNLQNGTYDYSAAPGNGSFIPAGGSFTINGSGVIVNITFKLVTRNVTFTEKGLPPGTPWGIFVSGAGNFSSLQGSFNVTLPPGHYSYMPDGIAGYNVSAGGNFTVGSANLTMDVNYSALPSPLELYNITIFEMGLPDHFNWEVSLNNSTQISYPEGTFTFALANGTYSLGIAAVNHRGRTLPGGMNLTLNVSGSGQDIIVVFYGHYVWIVVDFPFSNVHPDHHHSGHNNGDNGNHGSEDLAVVTRYRLF